MSKMDKTSFNETIIQNWATHFKSSSAIVQQPGTTLIPEKKYQGNKFIAIWHIGRHSFAQCDPNFELDIKRLIDGLPANTNLTGDLLREAWTKDLITAQDAGLTYYLFPPDLPIYSPPQPFQVRRLTTTDAETMSTLHKANTPEDVDEAFVEVDHEIAYGCLLGEQLVAAASGYERAGFLDIGVITHPEFRKMGLGRAVVGSVCSWAIDRGIIAQYRHDVLNAKSKGVAKGLNFQMYFKSETVYFK